MKPDLDFCPAKRDGCSCSCHERPKVYKKPECKEHRFGEGYLEHAPDENHNRVTTHVHVCLNGCGFSKRQRVSSG